MMLPLFVDGHVHIHPCFDIGRFFYAANRNLRVAAAARGYADGRWRGALQLVESGSERVFERLWSKTLVPPADIRVEQTNDAAALRVYVAGSEAIYLIAGRQIATRSGVEVLSLATREFVPDGLLFAEAMNRSCASDCLTAIPWGFGKWSASRGDLVRKELHSRAPGSIALGDNGGRLRFAPSPPLFRMAEKLGFPVLPGSDPFPFASQVERVGTFGFVLPEWEDNEDMPARTLLRRLRDLHASPSYFGSLTGLGRFTVSQVRMQIHNRLRATPAPV